MGAEGEATALVAMVMGGGGGCRMEAARSVEGRGRRGGRRDGGGGGGTGWAPGRAGGLRMVLRAMEGGVEGVEVGAHLDERMVEDMRVYERKEKVDGEMDSYNDERNEDGDGG